MGKIIAIVVIAAVAWFYYNGNFDFKNAKSSTIEGAKKEKSINLINSSRERRQADIDRVLQ